MIRLAIIGAGDRAQKYAEFVRHNPQRAEVVAIAEPNKLRLQKMADEFGVSNENCFDDWQKLLAQPQLADAAIISTPDHLHYEPSIAALKRGYHLLLEKPIAQTIKECLEIARVATSCNRIVGVCHVLRYFPSYSKVKEIIADHRIGEIISINHREPVGIERMTHAFVRGEWNNIATSNPMILSKACHDLDLLVWLTDDHCRSLSSYGSLRWFKAENAPAGSSGRCVDCEVEESCIFSAVDLYLRRKKWLRHFDSTSDDYIRHQLETGKYGRCVYRCDNNVVDNQVVSMLMERGAVINFSMDAFTRDSERTTHIMGTRGEIKACENYFEHIDFLTRTVVRKDYSHLAGENSFHSGADIRIVENFVDAISTNNPARMIAHINSSVESHRIAFEAEAKRQIL